MKATINPKNIHKVGTKVYISNGFYLDIATSCYLNEVREHTFLYGGIKVHFTRTWPKHNTEKLEIDAEITLDTMYVLKIEIVMWTDSFVSDDPFEEVEKAATFIDSFWRESDSQEVELINDDYNKLQEDILNEVS